ncbi:MAG: MauE/DoxX family redox-associated membrane protein [Gaiellaceae bacterium]
MGTILLIGRLVLAAVFAVAGAAKLADREGSRKAVADFGVPASLAGIVGIALPLAELSVAVALLPASSALVAAAGALGLLLAFSAAISISIARGQAPDCHCFGQLHSEPAGWSTLARNLGLAGVAAAVVVTGLLDDAGPSALAWIGRLDPTERAAVAAVALAVFVAAGAVWLGLHLLRAQAQLLERLDRLEAALERGGTLVADEVPEFPEAGLPVGTAAPEFTLPVVSGGKLALRHLLEPRKPLVLLFTDPNCGPCQAMLPDVARWQREYADETLLALVSGGSATDSKEKAEEHGVERVLADEERAVYRLYEGAGTPSAVLIDPGGVIRTPLVAGAFAIEHLVHRARGEEGTEWGIPIGEPAPELALPDLEGRVVDISEFRGEDTFFLRWSPESELCAEIREDLLRWEAERPAGAPRLVLLADGDPDEVRAQGFRSPVLHDASGEGAAALRVPATPSGVLVDAEGRIAWPVADGAEHVLRVLRSRPAAKSIV